MKLFLLLALLVGVGGVVSGPRQEREPTLVLAFMVRNEEANLRANLPKWRGVADAVVCGIDRRTSDRTAQAVTDSLPGLPHWLFWYEFEGFGAARTLVMQEAWRKFPHMSHILVVDPDWEPEEHTVSKADLDFSHALFVFTIYDRNGMTTRQSQWLMRHQPNITFKYRLHEVLMMPALQPGWQAEKVVPWVVHEVEVQGRESWHTVKGHGHTRSYERYLFDLDLLGKDAEEYEDDPHVLYYLGSTYLAALEAMVGTGTFSITPEMSKLIHSGIDALTKRAADHHLNNPNVDKEQSWSSLRWLGYSFQFLLSNYEQGVDWYTRCVEFDPARPDCPVFLSKHHRTHGHSKAAWESVQTALVQAPVDRRFGNNFYVSKCSLPLEGSLTILQRLQDHSQDSSQVFPENQLPALFLLGWRLLRTAQTECVTNGAANFIYETPEFVAQAERDYLALAATVPGGTLALHRLDDGDSCVPNGRRGDDALLERWGLWMC